MGFKGEWKYVEDSDMFELVRLAKNGYPNLAHLSEDYIRSFFEKYKKTALVFIQKTEIKGFAVYQEWPDALNFILICLPFSKERNLRVILQGRKIVPNKKIVWFDDKKMEARGI